MMGGFGGWGSLGAVHFGAILEFERWTVWGNLGSWLEGFGGLGNFWGDFLGDYGIFGEEFGKGWEIVEELGVFCRGTF